ncbi:hypothetical protein Tco_0685618 [Tanacetum coccineum]
MSIQDMEGGNFVTFSNPLFNDNDAFTSSDDESLPEEDDIESEDSYVSKLDDLDLLVIPLSKLNEDECFDPGDFKDDYYDLKGDIIYLESLLIKDTIPNLLSDVFLDHDPRSLEDEPDKDDLKNIVKVFDPEIQMKIISLTNVRFTFEDRHYFSLTFVIRIFLLYLTYSMDSSFLFSSESEDTIFDPDISAFSFYSLEPDIESEDSYVSKLDDLDLLVIPLSKLNEDECFDPGGDFILEEIKACLTSDSIPPGIDDDDFDPEGDIDDYYDLKGDIIYLESLLIKDTIPNLLPEVFLDHDPRSLEDEPDKDDLKNIVKVFDPEIQMKIISLTNVRLPL